MILAYVLSSDAFKDLESTDMKSTRLLRMKVSDHRKNNKRAGARVFGGIMEKNQLENFKSLFVEIKNHHATNAIELGAETIWSSKGGDDIDLASRERDRELLLKLQGRNRFYMKKVDEALFRIENGTFGECFECGCDTEATRLEARPTATHCIGCKEAQEREEGHIPYSRRSHTHGLEIVNNNVVSFPNKSDNAQAM